MRLVDADELVKTIESIHCKDCNNYNGAMCRACEWMDAMDYIEDAPAVDAIPREKWNELKETIIEMRDNDCTASTMDLIDRSEVQYKMLEILPEADNLEWYEQAKPDEVKDLVDELYNIVLNVNRIDAQQVKHGHWIELPKALNPNENPCQCSNCKHVVSFYYGYPKSKFCGECGAKMDRGRNVKHD